MRLKISYDRSKRFLAHYLGGIWARMDEHHHFLLGGGLAFSISLCIVPFVLIIFSVFGTILKSSSLEQNIDLIINAAIPYESYAFFVKGILLSRSRELIAYKDIYGIVGLLGLLFTASGLFSGMRTILNTVYRVQTRKSEVVGKLRDFGMVFLVLCFFLVSLTFSPVLEGLKGTNSTLPFLQFLSLGGIETYLYSFVSLTTIFLVFFVLYSLVPYVRLGWKVTAVSAFWTAVLWEIAVQGFGYYISHLASFERIYGAYTLLVVVAFWIYYASVIFIWGAEIGQLYRERNEGESAVTGSQTRIL